MSGGVSKGRRSPRGSPLSPTRLSRLEEKKELQGLNDRLAAYIDRVRTLELENSKLSVQVESIHESYNLEVVNLKSLYDTEIADARRLLDDTSKDKARLQIDVGKLTSTNEDLKTRLMRKDRELTNLEKSLSSAESEISELRSKLSSLEGDKKKLLAEVKELKEEVRKLGQQLAEAKTQLEAETLTRVDLENRNQSLREELQFKQQVYEKEIKETKKMKQIEISEIDSKIQADYETKLKNSLQELREGYENELRNNRSELEDLYQTKIDELSEKDKMSSDEYAQLTSSLRDTKRERHELTSRLSLLEGTNNSLQQRISDLERQLVDERRAHQVEQDGLRSELRDRERERAEQAAEYQELLDVKIALDLEIQAYRKLLEAEEERLNIATPKSSVSSRSRGTPLRSGIKRKREEEEEQTYETRSETSCELSLEEDSLSGDFVKLKNNGDKDVSLQGYEILRSTKAKGEETRFRFHSRAKITAGSLVTIHSCNSKTQVHNPPGDITMKNQAWIVRPYMRTSLLKDKEEVAWRETERKSEIRSKFEELPQSKAGKSRLYTPCTLV